VTARTAAHLAAAIRETAARTRVEAPQTAEDKGWP
jgi:hypothetical protein